MATVVILLGAPGAGKGTQAARLAAARGLAHVSTGELFRENLRNGTPLGVQARAFMDAGKLVPDELVLEMLFERVARPDCARGYVLDGFPRTLPQAQALGARLGTVHAVPILIDVPDQVLIERFGGRVSCTACGNVHHLVHSPPRSAGKCDRCGGELVRRPDDAPEVVGQRLRVYADQTAPVVRQYESQGALRRVDGRASPDQVFQGITRALGAAEAA